MTKGLVVVGALVMLGALLGLVALVYVIVLRCDPEARRGAVRDTDG